MKSSGVDDSAQIIYAGTQIERKWDGSRFAPSGVRPSEHKNGESILAVRKLESRMIHKRNSI